MKRIMYFITVAFVMMLTSSFSNNASAQYRDDVSYQKFYDELSPYGQWVDHPEYGYIWMPDAEPGFQPYSTNGHWVWTDDYEWMWVSDYDWGWAPFHYGRWDYDSYYGWFWVPDYEWSPAWVAWRDGGDYYGWAPLRPGIRISINFNIGSYRPPYNFWSFAPRRYITSPRIYDYYIDRRQNVTIINQTVIINNYNYSRNVFRTGPSRYNAEAYCGRINPVRFRDSYTPGRTSFRNNEVSVYRPNVRRDNERNYAPRQFEQYDRNNGNFRNGRNGNNGTSGNRIDQQNDRGNRQQDNRGNRIDKQDNRGNSNNQRDNRGNRFEQNNQERVNNRPDRVNDNSVRQQGNSGNGAVSNRRGFDRNNNSIEQPNRDVNTRVVRPDERPDRSPQGNGGNNNNRQFERRDNNGNGNSPVREPQVRNDAPQRQMRQQSEQRNVPQQVEQRRAQEQPRNFERAQNNVERQHGNGNGGSDKEKGNGKKRF